VTIKLNNLAAAECNMIRLLFKGSLDHFYELTKVGICIVSASLAVHKAHSTLIAHTLHKSGLWPVVQDLQFDPLSGGYRVTGKKKGLQSKLTTASLFIQSNNFMNKKGKFVTILKEKITDILSLLVIE